MFNQPFQIRSTSEQVAEYLRDRIQRGRLHGYMAGVHALADELGVHHTTVSAALRQLEAEGYLKGEGAGKKRRILLATESGGMPVRVRVRVAILLYEAEDIGTHSINELRHQLSKDGHDNVVATKSLVELEFKVERLKKLVKETNADAWLVIAGSREVLEWFNQQGVPTFALFGNASSLGLGYTGAVKGPLMREIVQRLVKLKHQRIVLLTGEQIRKPNVGPMAQAFLDELESQGLPSGQYNLPDWSYSKGSMQACLRSLFQITPPTAIIVGDPMLVPAVLQFANQRKMSIPEDMSLFCLDWHPSFKWLEPALCCLEVDMQVPIRNAVRWVNRFAKGQNSRRQFSTKVTLIEGGTLGLAPD